MREPEDKLKSCPACGQSVEGVDIGLRDFSWINDSLPGRVGMMDIDGFIEQSSSGRALVIERKPNKYLPTGQRLSLRWFANAGATVWIVSEKLLPEGKVEVAPLYKKGEVFGWITLTIEELAAKVNAWWAEGKSAA